MGLPATRKTATVGDRGEDNKDPDWLIGQSIVRQVAGGVLHCATAIESYCSRCKNFLQVELSSTLCNVARNKKVGRQVTEVTCYTVGFYLDTCVTS